jgi:Putative Ig domain
MCAIAVRNQRHIAQAAPRRCNLVMRTRKNLAFLPGLATLLAVTLLAAGCNDDVGVSPASTAAPASSTPSGSSPPPAASVQLSGTPAASVTVGSAYQFEPTVSAGGTVTFSVQGQPSWMAFNSATGALTGTPTASQEGSTGQITITASNGTSSASIGPFVVHVSAAAAASGSAALTWIAPTHNTNGTLITDLAGYHIYYGTNADDLTTTVNVVGGESTAYTVTGLSPGTYYFSVVAYNAEGVDSTDSNLESKTI